MDSKTIESQKTENWQKKLLPFMIGMLSVLTIFFFVASFIQIYYLHSRIEQSPRLDLAPALDMLNADSPTILNATNLSNAQWKTLSLLEGHALQRRYHQANVLLMSRVWTRYLGFVTGMILALVGAAFILGKLRESDTKLESEGVWKFSITTASPGLILALLGTLLMIMTIVTHFEIEVKDGPLYTSIWYRQPVANEIQVPVLQEDENAILDNIMEKLDTKEK